MCDSKEIDDPVYSDTPQSEMNALEEISTVARNQWQRKDPCKGCKLIHIVIPKNKFK